MREKYDIACTIHGHTLITKAEHRGMETGVFSGLNPGIDITTVGADCRYFHTYEEELDIASFLYGYLILKDLDELGADE